MMANVARAVWGWLPPDARRAARQRLPLALQRRLQTLFATQTCSIDEWHAPLSAPRDPIPLIMASAEYAASCAYFATCGAPSLLSPDARALLYHTVRLLRPNHVVEIGAFRGGTTQALALALAAVGRGIVHAIEPFVVADLRRTVAGWPRALRSRVTIYPTSSMQFFMDMRGFRAGVYLIDGNHDYEFAAFDIDAAARRLASGGMIFVDNVSQHGPFAAVRDFLGRNGDFYECGGKAQFDAGKPFDPHRTAIHNTDFMALRSEPFILVHRPPRNFGEHLHRGPSLKRARLELADDANGTLHIQAVLRGFGSEQTELVTSASLELAARSGALSVELPPLRIEGDHTVFRTELWLSFIGEAPLKLTAIPVLE